MAIDPGVLDRLLERIESGSTIKAAAEAVGVKVCTVHRRRARDPAFRARLVSAEAKRGFRPKRPPGRKDMAALLGELRKGSSLSAACRVAGISSSGLSMRRAADRELDRQVRALMQVERLFDDAAKAIVIEGIRRGEELRVSLSKAGGFHSETFRRHLETDPRFAEEVRASLGGYDDIRQQVRPTLAKAKFDLVLDLLRVCATLKQALNWVGVGYQSFQSLLLHSDARRAAYQSVIAGLPIEGRGKRAPRPACWRSVLEDANLQARVLEHVSRGAPLYLLSTIGLPSGSTCVAYAEKDGAFRLRLTDAMALGARQRIGDPMARVDAAIDAIARGVRPSNLTDHGLMPNYLLRSYRRRYPEIDGRYRAARRTAAGDVDQTAVLSVDELVELVRRRLPMDLNRDEKADCLHQAWIDASDGTLCAANVRVMAARYASKQRSESLRMHVDQNGDLRANSWD